MFASCKSLHRTCWELKIEPNQFAFRIRWMGVGGSRIPKEKVVDSKICGYVWTGHKFSHHVSRFIEPVGIRNRAQSICIPTVLVSRFFCGKGRLVVPFKGVWNLFNACIFLSDDH